MSTHLRFASALALSTAVLTGALPSQTQTVSTWIGGDGAWSEAANWDTNPLVPNNGQPLAGDRYDAVIGGGWVTLDQDASVSRLALSGGTLDLQQSEPLLILTQFGWTGGGITSGDGRSIALMSTATNRWSGALGLRNTFVSNGGNLTLSDGISLNLGGDYGVNTGLRNLPDGLVLLEGAGAWIGDWFGEGETPDGLNNQGTVIKTGQGTFLFADTGNSSALPFVNSGTVQVEEGSLRIEAAVSSDAGAWRVENGGSLQLRDVQTGAGSSISGPGSVVFDTGNSFLSGSYTIDKTSTTLAHLRFDSVNPVSFPVLVIGENSSVGGSTALSVAGALTWAGSIHGDMPSQVFALDSGAEGVAPENAWFVLDRRTFNNSGRFVWTGGITPEDSVFGLHDGAVFNNSGGATFLAAGNGLGGTLAAPSSFRGVFVNSGTFEKTGAGTWTRLNWAFGNSGLVDALSGRLEVPALSQPGGAFRVAAGASLELGRKDGHSSPEDFPFTGVYSVEPGAVVEFKWGALQPEASFPEASGIVVFLESLHIVRDALPSDVVRFAGFARVAPPSRTLTVAHAEIVSGGGVGLASGDILKVTSSLDWVGGSLGSPLLGDQGGMLETAEGSLTTISNDVSMAISTWAAKGSVRLSPESRLAVSPGSSIVNEGIIRVENGAVLELNPSSSAPFRDARIAGGSIVTSGSGSLSIGRGSSIIGSETYGTLDGTAVSGIIDLASNHSKVRLLNGASFSGSARFSAEGAANYTAFELHQDGVIDNALFLDTTPNLDAKAAFVVIGSHTVTLGPDVEMRNLTSISGDYFNTNIVMIINTGDSTLINRGRVLVQGIGRQTRFGAMDTFANQGTLEARDGATLLIDREFTQSAGQILLVNGARFTMTDPSYRPSARTLAMTGGSIEGEGVFTGTVRMTGGFIAPGNEVGRLDIEGHLTATTGHLAFELSGSDQGVSVDLLEITGACDLPESGPDLRISLIGKAEQTILPTSTFTVIRASSLTGRFANVANGGRLDTADGLGSFQVNYGPESAFEPDAVVLSAFAPNQEAPVITLAANGLLTWPRTLQGAVPQTTTNVVTGPWIAVTNAPVLVGDLYQLAVDFSAPQQFYRIGPTLGVFGLPAVKTP